MRFWMAARAALPLLFASLGAIVIVAACQACVTAILLLVTIPIVMTLPAFGGALIQSLSCLVGVAFARRLLAKDIAPPAGKFICLALIAYAMADVAAHLRGPTTTSVTFGMAISELVSIPVFAIAFFWIVRAHPSAPSAR